MKQVKTINYSRKRKALLCAMVSSALLSQLSSISYAAEPEEYILDQMVVTATKTPVKEFEANANITVITRQEIEKKHYRDLGEALKAVPGVNITSYGAGGESYTANGLFINGTANVVVLIDGVRANVNGSTFNKFPAAEFNAMNNIERIEVLKGSASTLYGSDAQGGVINIITRKVDGDKTTLQVANGSYGREDYSFSHQGVKGDFSWLITSKKEKIGDYKDGKGLVIPTQQDAVTNTIKLNKKINDASDVTLDYQSYNSDYMRSGPNNKLTDRNYGEKDNYKISAVYNYKISEDTTNQLSVFKNVNCLNDSYNKKSSLWLMDLETIGVQDQFTTKLGDHHQVTAGFDWYQDKINKYISNSGTPTVYAGKTITNRALYVQDEWDFDAAWKLTSGIRLDNHSMYGRHTTPSFTLGYKESEKTNYYVGYKEFFVSPNQSQLFSPQYNRPSGNLDLQPETGHTIEAGVNHKFDNSLVGSFHIFKRNSKNIVKFYTDDAAVGMSTRSGHYYNQATEEAQGWDLQLNKVFNKHLTAFVGYTHTNVDPENDKQNANIDGKLPTGTWNIGMDYTEDKWNIGLQGRGVMDRLGRKVQQNQNFYKVNTYWVWDMAVNYKATDQVTAFLKVANLFNRYYTEQAYELNPAKWYSSPGRNFQVGIQYQF